MGVPSTYIHSNKEHAGNLSVSTKVINGITYYIYKRNVKAAAFGFNIY